MNRIMTRPATATRPAALIYLLAAAALSGCAPSITAPADSGVCWHMVEGKKGEKPVYHKVADAVPNLESCALDLEAMRTRFLRMGGGHTNIEGAFQGMFLYVERGGVYSSTTLGGATYLALPRAPDGGLMVQGRPVRTPTPAS